MDNNYRILVVDDEQDLCEILKFNLETDGYVVETANSAEEALKMNIESFDLLLHGLERQIVFGNLTENIIYVLGFGGRAQEQRRRKHGHSFHFFSSFSLKIS